MRVWMRNNGLSVALMCLFLFAFFGQIVTGFFVYNENESDHAGQHISFGNYLTTGHFVEAVFENWESEFLQDAAYVMLTVYLFQRGSAESKDPDKDEAVDADPRDAQDDPNAPWPVRYGGIWLTLYKNSLFIAFMALFVAAFLLHAAGGAVEYNHEQLQHGGEPVSMLLYMTTSQFWFESFQNWQSEFLALFSIVVLSIFLRQHGSPESKPVASPHSATGES